MNKIDANQFLLPEDRNSAIFDELIIPRELAATPVQDPTVVFVAGQPGAGKTRTTASVMDVFDSKDADAVQINSDFYKPYHPQYNRLMRQDHMNAAPYTRADGRVWMAKAEEYARENNLNTVIETTMRPPSDFLYAAKEFREAGFEVEVLAMSVPAAQSRLGILSRYTEQLATDGAGRLTETANHDAAYAGLVTAVEAIDATNIADRITIIRRGNEIIYQNNVDENGQWKQPPAASATIESDRDRQWTVSESRDFRRAFERLSKVDEREFNNLREEVRAMASPQMHPGIGLKRANKLSRTKPTQQKYSGLER